MGRRSAGYTFIELVTVLAVTGVLTAVAIPPLGGALRRFRVNNARELIAAEVRSARLSAVKKNRTMRVRFDCPGPGQFRIVEVVGNPAIDNDADRCSEAAYPFPDPDPLVAPNNDGPVQWLKAGVTFGGAQDLQISPRGRVRPLRGCPTCTTTAPPANIGLTNGYETQTITVAVSGMVASREQHSPTDAP